MSELTHRATYNDHELHLGNVEECITCNGLALPKSVPIKDPELRKRFAATRDQCQVCGASSEAPVDYDGRGTVAVGRQTKGGFGAILHVDHIVPRCRGGSNHPKNLQALCECCNAAKSGHYPRRRHSA